MPLEYNSVNAHHQKNHGHQNQRTELLAPTMKRAFAIAAVIAWVVVVILFHSAIKNFLWTHPWWHSFVVAVPGLSVPILAFFELRHSTEANSLRAEANDLRRENVNLREKLDTERNEHLQQIAKSVARPVTEAQRNAEILREHLHERVVVHQGQNNWGVTPEIVEVDDEVATLFQPREYSSSRAWSQKVRCGELVITEITQGACHLRLDVLERHGNPVDRGEITRWEDRLQPTSMPIFPKGSMARYATYGKSGSSERRTLCVYASRDGSNSFLLEASTGENAIANNVEISKRFVGLQIEYEAAGFTRTHFKTGDSVHGLYIQ